MSEHSRDSAAASDHDGGGGSGGDRGDGGAAAGGRRTALDRKGGVGHTTLVAVLLAVPVVKIAYTVGDAERARTVLLVLGVRSLPEVLVGMVLDSPWLGFVLAVVASRVVFAFFAARGAVPRGRLGARVLAETIAVSLVNPIALGVLAACLYGWPWALATGLVAAALRQGVVIEYRTGRRHRHGHPHEHEHEREREREAAGAAATHAPLLTARRFAAVEQWLAGALVVAVLPFAALAEALDGRSWAPVVVCTIDLPGSPARAGRLIELTRDGTGVVGWDPAEHEVLNGDDCTDAGSRTVRPAWWNG